jgi:hypothetical protein
MLFLKPISHWTPTNWPLGRIDLLGAFDIITFFLVYSYKGISNPVIAPNQFFPDVFPTP